MERTPRSLLFCPGHDPGKIAKALRSGADAVILDLEDAVAPDQKVAAREVVAGVLRDRPSLPVVVRVNDAGTPHHLADIAAIVQAGAHTLMLPKCASRKDLWQLSYRIDALEAAFGHPGGAIRLIPLISETAASLQALDYRGAPGRLLALAFAAEDLSSDLGVATRDETGFTPLLARARLDVAVAAAAAGVPAIDTPFPDTRDADGLQRESIAAAQLGFAGKLCIHPAQIPTVHAALLPSPKQIDWAKAVLDALDNGRIGVAVVAGRMVDTAHLSLARRVLAAAGEEA